MILKTTELKLHKKTSNAETIELPAKGVITIPMRSGDCTECVPCVKAGERVYIGEEVGRPEGDGVPVYTGASGTVTEICELTLPDGRVTRGVRIECSEIQQISADIKPPVINSKESFIEAVRRSGLCGLSGAGVPTYKKLIAAEGADMLIVNAAECEPYLTTDHREIMENSSDIITGIKLITDFLGIGQAVVAISKAQPEALKLMRELCANEQKITVKALEKLYPLGADKMLAYVCAKRRVMYNETPTDKGLLILNVSTVGFIGSYTVTGMPLIRRRVTVDGDAVRTPCNIRAVIGTPVSSLLEFADCRVEAAETILLGGPMMGKRAESADTPLTKETGAVTAYTAPIKDKKYNEANRLTGCIRCGRCTDACPMGLMPSEIEKAFDKGNTQKLKKLRAYMCFECGACSYVCPAKRELSAKAVQAKTLIAQSDNTDKGANG